MTTYEFFNGFVDPICHKVEHDTPEMQSVRIHPGLLMIKATTFYQIYKHNVFGTDDRLSLQDFFRVAGQYLYYDKYVCKHGTEFYYLVVLNPQNRMVALTKNLIESRVRANRPETLSDLVHVLTATVKE
jgi:hypothetical protein